MSLLRFGRRLSLGLAIAGAGAVATAAAIVGTLHFAGGWTRTALLQADPGVQNRLTMMPRTALLERPRVTPLRGSIHPPPLVPEPETTASLPPAVSSFHLASASPDPIDPVEMPQLSAPMTRPADAATFAARFGASRSAAVEPPPVMNVALSTSVDPAQPAPASISQATVPLPRAHPLRPTGSDVAAASFAPAATPLAGAVPPPGAPNRLRKYASLTRPDVNPLALFDNRTAVYDISARTVYMPNGTRLVAHSGLGHRMDDPRFVHEKNRGATPPNTYSLRLRESLFHGVRALRMTPVDGSKMYGRDGILAHTYMLGPTGQSNGCVSFQNYQKFLDAYLRGEIDKIVVVARLADTPTFRDPKAPVADDRRMAFTAD